MTVEIKRRFRAVIGFRFDAMATWLLCQKYDIELDKLDDIPKDERADAFIYSAYRSFVLWNIESRKWRRVRGFTFSKMRKYIALMPKRDWELLVKAMTEVAVRATEKKKSNLG